MCHRGYARIIIPFYRWESEDEAQSGFATAETHSRKWQSPDEKAGPPPSSLSPAPLWYLDPKTETWGDGRGQK